MIRAKALRYVTQPFRAEKARITSHDSREGIR